MEGTGPALARWLRGWAVVPAVLLGGLGLTLLGLYALERWTRERLHETAADRVAFTDIDCEPPPGRSKADFLHEVRYESGLPAELSVLEDGLPDRLASAFAGHPYVGRVERVEITPDGKIRIQLTYRTPVLAVVNDGHSFQVDAHGVHLGPVHDRSLPSLQIMNVSNGKLDEAAVRAAARTAEFLHSRELTVKLRLIEGPANRLVLRGTWNNAVIWGHAPGDEALGEAKASAKLQALLAYAARAGASEPGQPVDLRWPASAAEHEQKR